LPLLCNPFGLAQSLLNEFDVPARRLSSSSRFLPESMENVHCVGVPDGVDRTKRVAAKVSDHFQDGRPGKAAQRLDPTQTNGLTDGASLIVRKTNIVISL